MNDDYTRGQCRRDYSTPNGVLAADFGDGIGLAKDHLLTNIYHASPGDPARLQPTNVTFDLSPWQGQTVRLRLATADNQGPLRAGVDNLRFERIGQ